VVSHGVATWVVEPVQQALLAVASASLVPDGLFYCSPTGWWSWRVLSRSSVAPGLTLRKLITAGLSRHCHLAPGSLVWGLQG
jgi:hypothetical protein